MTEVGARALRGRRRSPAGPVTIAEVARHAHVAPSAVSYVLSGKRSISASTRQRVLASVRELGYHPHAGARALASNRSNVIALVLPLRAGTHLPVVMRFAASVVTAARQFDHDVLLVTADEGPDGLRRVAASALVDGLVLMDVELDDRRYRSCAIWPRGRSARRAERRLRAGHGVRPPQPHRRVPDDVSVVAIC